MRRFRGPELTGPRSVSAGGFTLVEMLTAAAVLILITLGLANIASHAGTIWARGESQNQHRQRARAALDFIGWELRNATLAVNHSGSSLQFVINPAGSPSLGSKFLNHDSIFWQAPIATDTSDGDLAEIGYFVRWDGSEPKLCRLFVNPSDPNYLIYDNPSAWLSDALLDEISPADKDRQYQGLFLENVLGLWAKAYNADGSEYGGNSRAVNNALPASVTISLVLVDANTVKKVDDPEVVKNLVSSSATASDFLHNPALPPRIKQGISIVENVVDLNGMH